MRPVVAPEKEAAPQSGALPPEPGLRHRNVAECCPEKVETYGLWWPPKKRLRLMI